MSEYVLYNYFRSSTSYRVRIALNLKGISYDYRPVHLLNNGGEQHSAQYRNLNPMGGVPTLVHRGKVFSQSMAVIEYLDEIKESPKLFPGDAALRAKIRQFCENINADTHPLTNLKVLQDLEKNVGVSQQQKDRWTSRWITEGLRACERMLIETAGTYCFGGQITAADLFLVPQIFTAKRFNVDLSALPTIQRIDKSLSDHPAFVSAHPFRQPDTPADQKIK
jgi:maleylacetoacetate isomerase